jgi:beta-glucosidase
MNDPVEVAAAAIKAGVNLDCSNLLQKNVLAAYHRKLINDVLIDSSLGNLLRTQFKLGFYDEKGIVPFTSLGAASVHSPRSVCTGT